MPENFPDEDRQLEHAAPAPGLGEKTVQPFQIEPLQPGGRAWGDARHEVKGASDADGDCGWQLSATVVDPEILSRVAIGDEKDVWGGAMQGSRDCCPFFFGGAPGIAAGDGEAGVQPGKLLCGSLGDAGGGAQKKDPPALLGGARADVVDAVGSGHTFGQLSAQPCGGPQHTGAVGHAEVGVCQHRCKGWVAVGIDDELGVDCADLAAGEGAAASRRCWTQVSIWARVAAKSTQSTDTPRIDSRWAASGRGRIGGLAEHSQRLAGGFFPGKTLQVGVAGCHELLTQRLILAETEHGVGDGVDIGRIDEQGAFAGDLGQGRVIGCQDWNSVALGFQHGQAEAFEERWKRKNVAPLSRGGSSVSGR